MKRLRRRAIAKAVKMKYRNTHDGWEIASSYGTVGVVGKITDEDFIGYINALKR